MPVRSKIALDDGVRFESLQFFDERRAFDVQEVSRVPLVAARTLERTQGNKRQAAKLLNLKRTTLIEKLKRLEPNGGAAKLP